MTLPKPLTDEIKKGRVILFLGSGALYGASIPGKNIPLGNDLRDLLCDEFLDESFKQDSLAHVSAIAISQNSLFKVQNYIRDYFADLEPAGFHYEIPKYKWRALFTTNYDRLIEICYEKSKKNIQTHKVILSNEDSLDETRRTNDILPVIKLHGCITRTNDQNLPLILTVDQYNESFENRKRLFDHLFELAYENTIVFIGHSLQDHNVRSVMLRLHKECADGQRHYLIKPGVKEPEKDYWSEQKIKALDITFKDFLSHLKSQITENDVALSLVRPTIDHPIQEKYTDNKKPSEELIRFLTDEADFIGVHLEIEPQKPKEFYKGISKGWFAASESLGIKRSIEDTIYENTIEKPEADRSPKTELYVIKGEAGSGKTVLLRQLAWRARNSDYGVFIWIKANCSVDVDHVEDISIRSKERVFIIWDDGARNTIEMSRFLIKARRKNIPVTVITAERHNEWNIRCDDLDEIVTEEFDLRYLSEIEIEELIRKLEKYDSLGPNLQNKSFDERKIEFREIHGRQLLVALHEATMGEPFEDIVYNEYCNIYPETAKAIYLTVCTLNRLRVPIRAGLISRIYDISFEKFSSQFYKPLEKVVIIKGQESRDIHYTARHPEIAEIVFRRALDSIEDRYNEYIKILNKLNISYSSDKSSFRILVRAKSLNELFPSYEDVRSIYKHAQEAIGDDPYLLQQMANYERIRPNGSLENAKELLEKAMSLAPYDSSIIHTLATVWRDQANTSESLSSRSRCRRESRSYLEQIARKWGGTSYISMSLIELSIDNLNDIISDVDSSENVINDAIRRVQEEITDNKQKYPSNGNIYTLELKLSDVLNDYQAALTALEKSFEDKDRDPYIAIRLATTYKDMGDFQKAKKILQLALERRRSHHKLNFQYAEIIREDSISTIKEIIYYYRRAFTPGDDNYQAQFWFARYCYESNEDGDHQKSLDTFESLRNLKLARQARVKIRDYYGSEETPILHRGSIVFKRKNYGFIKVDGTGDRLFCPAASVSGGLWDAMENDDRVQFHIGYSYSGIVTCNVAPS